MDEKRNVIEERVRGFQGQKRVRVKVKGRKKEVARDSKRVI